ncbi:MAG: methyl-accepting chemotaxis protein [Myxococcaceae bacterium]
MTATPNQPFLDDLVLQQFDRVLEDTARARGLVKDAIPSILKAFQDVNERLAAQFDEVMTVSAQLGEAGKEGLLTTMRGIVDTFVQDLVTISSQSMKIVERVTHMSQDVDNVLVNVDSIEDMASTTRFIALNAHIEAYRSGPAGTTFRVVAEEVKHLAGDAHEFSGQIRAAVDRFRTRLDETRTLVSLLASHDLNGALAAQSRMLAAVDEIRRVNEGLVVSIKLLEQTVATAIRALQFDDILSQLLVSISERIGTLRKVWLETVQDDPSVAAAGERHRAAFDKQPTVTQADVSAGTVDLF